MKNPLPARISMATRFNRLGLLLILAICSACVESPTTLLAQATESTIYSFSALADGEYPFGALVEDKAGNFYGVAQEGGRDGGGTAFELSPKAGGGWTETTIHAFTGGMDGAHPSSGLVIDSLGNLYGTTSGGGKLAGGARGHGVVFKLSPSGAGAWQETVLYTFQGTTDGGSPGNLTADSLGNLYGYAGNIFQLSPSKDGQGSWTFTVVYQSPSFINSLVSDQNGNLYAADDFGADEFGEILKLARQKDGWVESVFLTFEGYNGGLPQSLVLDASGNLYGIAGCYGSPYCSSEGGLVFELSSAGAFSVLYEFTGNVSFPAVLAFSNGALYGATSFGGNGACNVGCGILFALRKSADGNWNETVTYDLLPTDVLHGSGFGPLVSGLTVGADGHLYGLTSFPNGTAFEIALPPQPNSAVLPPAFSPSSGVYASAQTVTITDSTPGASIYYTTDGTLPTAASTPYTGAIPVSSTERITAVAIVPNTPPATASAVYSIAPSSEAPGSLNFGVGFATAASALRFNGTTDLDGARLQLTDGGSPEAGSAFTAAPVNIQAFTTYFTFQQTEALADGFTFTIQNQASTALGGIGGYLGYQGIPQSVAIKFDIHNNDGEGNDSTGLYVNGAVPTMPSIDLTSSGIALRSGDPMLAQITYDGTNLVLTLTDTATFATWSHSFAIDIPTTVGGDTAFVGFTGATGGLAANQEVLSWTYVAGSPVAGPPALAAPALPAFSSGFNALGLTSNGSASLAGTALQLTDNGLFEAASAFYANPLNIQSFTTDFTFQLGSANASIPLSDLEDGITFAIQNVGATALGDYGKALGYAPIGTSVAIKFDTHNDAGEGQDSTGLYVDGALPTVPSVNLAGTGINLHSGDPFAAHVVYNGATLAITLTDTVTLATWSHSFTIDIPETVGGTAAYVGFTGSTGTLSSTQQVLNWSFTHP